MKEKPVLELDPVGASPEVGRWLAALENSRHRTLRTLKDLPASVLDEPSDAGGNTIGTVLYHLAAIEADWLFEDILGPESGAMLPTELFPYDVRDADWILTAVRGLPLEQHLERLAAVRRLVLQHLGPMAVEDFQRPRSRSDYDVAPDWVVHHLMQHEAEHRSQIENILMIAGHPPQ